MWQDHPTVYGERAVCARRDDSRAQQGDMVGQRAGMWASKRDLEKDRGPGKTRAAVIRHLVTVADLA
jgi:hypothetical protein